MVSHFSYFDTIICTFFKQHNSLIIHLYSFIFLFNITILTEQFLEVESQITQTVYVPPCFYVIKFRTAQVSKSKTNSKIYYEETNNYLYRAQIVNA